MGDNNNTFGTTMNKALKDDGDDFLNTALRKWKFNSKYKRNQILFCVLLIFFLIFGIVFLCYYLKIKQYRQRYDSDCKLNELCTVELDITDDMPSPIFFYYEIDNFFQTHRKFYQSKDILQLRGEDRTSGDLLSCAPFITNAQLGKTQSYQGYSLNPNDPAIPCGLIAKTFFNDSFSLQTVNGTKVVIDEKDIAWNVDVDYNYKQTIDADKKAWIDVTDNHFMVWMRTSGMGKFKKLWGRIKEDLPVGKYLLTIDNKYNSTEFNGQKYVLITTSTPFGQKNIVLIVAYFSGAFVCMISIGVLYSLNKSKKDK